MIDGTMQREVPDLGPIRRAAGRAERRMRIGRALAWGVVALCVAAATACVALALRKTGVIPERPARVALAVLASLPIAAAVIALARRLDVVPGRAGAVALDRFHGLADRLSSALAFAGEAQPTPFMRAAIDDALAHVGGVDPRRAVPIRAPKHLGAAGGLLLALLAIGLFEVRRHVPAAHAPTIDALDVTPDDVDAMREFLARMQETAQTDDAKAATREFNQLVEDLAARRLDRTEAFRRMQQLEDKLLEGREADAKALEEAMKKIGEEMKLAELTKPAGEALDQKNLVDAEKQLHDLAKKLRDGKADKAQLEKMRAALAKAAESQSKRQELLAKRREELQQQLLAQRQKQADAGAQDEERSLLQKRERELERLDREREQAAATGRQLDRLDRELAQAAEDLMKDLGLSANDLDQSAEDINRLQKEQMSQEEKEQLRQKLEELRQTLRQQGQGGQGQMARLRRFQMQARGQGQGQGQRGQGQGDGQGEEGQGQEPGQGQGQGQGEGDPSNQAGGGSSGHGQRGSNGETWVLGPNGEKILMLSRGSSRSGSGGSSGQGGTEPGHGWGTEHDAHPQGRATQGVGATQDTQVAGQDTGEGASRSEVIEGAAERGFASHGYQKVYREYETVAEEALGKDEIPGGYRFYVRRYFELIRPRDQQGATSAPAPAPTNK